MIFGLFGFPRLGVTGAALATVISFFIAMSISLTLNITKNTDISITFKGFKPNLASIKQIYAVGLPAMINQGISSVMVFGMNNGSLSILAYNYGAKKKDRIIQTLRLNITACFCVLTGFGIWFIVAPESILALFAAGEDLAAIGVPGIRLISAHLPLAGIVVALIGFSQAIGNGVDSLIVSAVRQLVFLLPLAFLLSVTMGLDAIWWSFPLAECFTLLVAIILARRAWKAKISHL